MTSPRPNRRAFLTGLLAAPLAARAPGVAAEPILPGHRLYRVPQDRVAEFLKGRKCRQGKSFIISVRYDELTAGVEPAGSLPLLEDRVDKVPGRDGVDVKFGAVKPVHCEAHDDDLAIGSNAVAHDHVSGRGIAGRKLRFVRGKPLGEHFQSLSVDGHDEISLSFDVRRAG